MMWRKGATRPLSILSALTRTSFFLPAVVLLLVLVVYPVLQTLVLSFFSGGDFVGSQNYQDVLGRPETLNTGALGRGPPYGTLVNNLLWTLVHLPLSLFTGLFLAILLQRVRGSSIVKSIIFLGMVTPLIVIGVILRFLLEAPIGIVPSFFGAIGVESLNKNWLVHPATLLLGLILGTVWSWTGFSMIVYSAGLTTIPKDYFEAARVDGASGWRIFTRITWPLLRPITMVVVTMTILFELKLFDIVIAATNANGGVGGAADVLALQMYRYAFVALPALVHWAAVVATLLTVFTMIAAFTAFRRILGGPPLGLASYLGHLLRELFRRVTPS